MSQELRNVFISHIHEDDKGLADFKSLLQNNGLTVRDYSITADKENNAKAEEYIKYQILAPRIDACSAMVVYLTKDSKDSSWVDWEIEHAFKKGKTIVGVYERGSNGCELPRALDLYANAIVGWDSQNIIDAINGSYSGICDASDTPMNHRKQIKPHPCG